MARRKEGQGGRRDEEEEWTRRKEGRGRRDEKSKKMKKLLTKMTYHWPRWALFYRIVSKEGPD